VKDHWNVLYQVSVFYADRKSKMATTTGHGLTLDPMGKCSNAFFSSLVSEKKIFEISANQSILLALAAMLNIRLERKNRNFVEDHPRNILQYIWHWVTFYPLFK
jgi:hypothetical protein